MKMKKAEPVKASGLEAFKAKLKPPDLSAIANSAVASTKALKVTELPPDDAIYHGISSNFSFLLVTVSKSLIMISVLAIY